MTTFRLWARAAFDAFTLAIVATVLALVTAPLWGSWLAYRRLRDGAWPLFLAALLALTSVGAVGCGGSALDQATTALGAAHAIQSGAVNATRVRVRDDLREACAGETTSEAIDECIAERAERWRATEAGLDVSGRALDEAGVELLTWAVRVDADDADPNIAPRRVCHRMKAGFEAVADVMRLLDALGVRMPEGMPTWECRPDSVEEAEPAPEPEASPAAPASDPTADPATSGGTP